MLLNKFSLHVALWGIKSYLNRSSKSKENSFLDVILWKGLIYYYYFSSHFNIKKVTWLKFELKIKIFTFFVECKMMNL